MLEHGWPSVLVILNRISFCSKSLAKIIIKLTTMTVKGEWWMGCWNSHLNIPSNRQRYKSVWTPKPTQSTSKYSRAPINLTKCRFACGSNEFDIKQNPKHTPASFYYPFTRCEVRKWNWMWSIDWMIFAILFFFVSFHFIRANKWTKSLAVDNGSCCVLCLK